MGNGQPYLYNPPARYSAIDPYNGFNPKSVTMATNIPPPPPKPKPQGPLLDFNQHPDSHLILPGRQFEPAPMSPSTKSRINWTRRTQLCLRVIQLLGAIGILVCVICIRGSTNVQSMIIRIPVSRTHASNPVSDSANEMSSPSLTLFFPSTEFTTSPVTPTTDLLPARRAIMALLDSWTLGSSVFSSSPHFCPDISICKHLALKGGGALSSKPLLQPTTFWWLPILVLSFSLGFILFRWASTYTFASSLRRLPIYHRT